MTEIKKVCGFKSGNSFYDTEEEAVFEDYISYIARLVNRKYGFRVGSSYYRPDYCDATRFILNNPHLIDEYRERIAQIKNPPEPIPKKVPWYKPWLL